MMCRKLQFALAGMTAWTALVGTAGTAAGQCCTSLFRSAPAAPPVVATTTFRPWVAYSAPVVAQQSVSYLPYTSYRTVYTQTPVTTYMPTTACNACGGATTVMQPVTSYTMRPSLVPFTSYRPVITAAYAAPACGCAAAVPAAPVMAPAAVGVPYAQYQVPAAPSGCSSCAGGAPQRRSCLACPAAPCKAFSPISTLRRA